jgi:hypothetical protein
MSNTGNFRLELRSLPQTLIDPRLGSTYSYPLFLPSVLEAVLTRVSNTAPLPKDN